MVVNNQLNSIIFREASKFRKFWEEKEAETEFLELQLGVLQRDREVALVQVQSLERENCNLLHEVALLREQMMADSPSRNHSGDNELDSPGLASSTSRHLRRELAAEQGRSAALAEELSRMKDQMKVLETAVQKGRATELYWLQRAQSSNNNSPRSFVEWRIQRELRQGSDGTDEACEEKLEAPPLEEAPLLTLAVTKSHGQESLPRQRRHGKGT